MSVRRESVLTALEEVRGRLMTTTALNDDTRFVRALVRTIALLRRHIRLSLATELPGRSFDHFFADPTLRTFCPSPFHQSLTDDELTRHWLAMSKVLMQHYYMATLLHALSRLVRIATNSGAWPDRTEEQIILGTVAFQLGFITGDILGKHALAKQRARGGARARAKKYEQVEKEQIKAIQRVLTKSKDKFSRPSELAQHLIHSEESYVNYQKLVQLIRAELNALSCSDRES